MSDRAGHNIGKRIKIIHCIGTLRFGGAEKQLTELICRLPADRFEQRLVLLQEGSGPLLDRIEQAGCLIYSLGYNRKFSNRDPFSIPAMGFALGKYIRYLRWERPDILHAQLYWANVLTALAGRLAGIKNIVVSHRQLASLKGNSKILAALERLSNRRARGIVANSEAVKRDIVRLGGVSESKIRKIYNGVVLTDFDANIPLLRRSDFQLLSDDVAILTIANLHPYKGHEDLLRAFADLCHKHKNLKLLLAGRDQGMESKLKVLAEELGIAGNAVLFLGERSDIPALLKIVDIVAHPSHQEGFSNSILEAMAAGRPLVVSDVGGNPESVRHGDNGFVVPVGDYKQLGAALENLIANPELRMQMGTASRIRVQSEFSIERTVAEYMEYYPEMAGSA